MFNSRRTISSFLGGGAVVDYGACTLCEEQRGREANDCKDPDLGSGSTSPCPASGRHALKMTKEKLPSSISKGHEGIF